MSKTLSDARYETRTYLDESSERDFVDEEVDIAINRSYHDVIGKVMDIWEEYYSTTTPFTYAIVADQQEYSIDSSLIKVTRVEINYNPTSDNSVPARAIPIKKDEVRGNLGNTSNGGTFFLASYYIHGSQSTQKIGFIPIPTISDTTGESISVWGITLPDDLEDPGDEINIPYADRFCYLIAQRAAAQLLRKGQQEENAARNYISEYQAGIIDMQNFLKDRQGDDMQIIIDSAQENIDFSVSDIT